MSSPSLLSLPEIPPSLLPPPSLCRCWRRDWIKQTFREARATDERDGGIAWYLQLANGLCIDARIDLSGGGDHDCFAGLALWDEKEQILNWHPVVGYTAVGSGTGGAPTSGEGDSDFESMLKRKIETALVDPASTEDRGRVEWEKNANARGRTTAVWYETDVIGGKEVLEERWVALDGDELAGVQSLTDGGPVGVAGGEKDFCRHRTTPDGVHELFVKQGGVFAHVAVKLGGRTEYSMGIAGDGPWEIKLSTEEGQIEREIDRTFWLD